MALLLYYFRRTWRSGILSCIALFAFQLIVCWVFQDVTARDDTAALSRFIPKWVQSLFSIDPAAISALTGFVTVSYQHPFQLAVLLGVPIAAATAFLAGDIEQRSIGLLLARPVSRFLVVIASAIVCLVWPALGIASSLAGTVVGQRWLHLPQPVNLHLLVLVGVNLYVLIAALSAITLALSSIQSQRGDAMGWAVTVALLMYVWNFLAQLWSASGSFPNYSLFRYYNPAGILLRGAQPAHDVALLGIVIAAALLFSALTFRFRDITV